MQTYGTLSVAAATLTVSLVLMNAVKLVGALRVSDAGEREGLDIHEHGAAAYPEFVVARGMQSSIPSAAPSVFSATISTPSGATVTLRPAGEEPAGG